MKALILNLATKRGAIKSHCAHISTALILNSNDKEDIVISRGHEDLLEISNFTVRFICRIFADLRPDWRPIVISCLMHAELVAELHRCFGRWVFRRKEL